MLQQDEAGVVEVHRDVILDTAEKAAVQRAEADCLRAVAAGSLKCIGQGQQPVIGAALAASAIEEMPEDRVP